MFHFCYQIFIIALITFEKEPNIVVVAIALAAVVTVTVVVIVTIIVFVDYKIPLKSSHHRAALSLMDARMY